MPPEFNQVDDSQLQQEFPSTKVSVALQKVDMGERNAVMYLPIISNAFCVQQGILERSQLLSAGGAGLEPKGRLVSDPALQQAVVIQHKLLASC